MPKTKLEGMLLKAEFTCMYCHEPFEKKADEITFSGHDNPCEACQSSHGEVSVRVECPHCHRYLFIVLSTW